MSIIINSKKITDDSIAEGVGGLRSSIDTPLERNPVNIHSFIHIFLYRKLLDRKVRNMRQPLNIHWIWCTPLVQHGQSIYLCTYYDPTGSSIQKCGIYMQPADT